MSYPHRILPGISIVWESWLATLSFLFFKGVKFMLRHGLSCYYSLIGSQVLRWRFLSPELLKTPGALLTIMTIGPRWNTHAIVATAGPVVVEKSLAVNVAAAERSARVWTLAISTFPRYQTVTTIGSRNTPFDSTTMEVSLRPGRYWLALRYYHWGARVELPALTIDGVEVIHSTTVPFDVNDFYSAMIDRNNLLYRCLHYYVYVLLRYRRFFPAAFVEREFVPLGNPETRFEFGAMEAGERLSIQTDPSVLFRYDIYVTIYNRASFPVVWYQVTDGEFATAESAARCVYLVRIHSKEAGPGEFRDEGLKISVLGCARR
jgi:Family of unknown function (DUF6208)